MARLYVPLDVDFATDDKILAAGPLASYLYLCSLAFSKRTLADGQIKRGQLGVLAPGLSGKLAAHAQKLVEVGLWSATDEGWLIAAWAKRNLLSDKVIEVTERKRQRALKANHAKWHVDGKRSDDCPYCDPPDDPRTIQQGSNDGLLERSTFDPKPNTETKPKPEAITDDPSDDPPNERIPWDQAWNHVLEAVRRHGLRGWAEIGWPDPGIVQAVRAVGWSNLCEADPHRLTTLRTQFRTAYLATAGRAA